MGHEAAALGESLDEGSGSQTARCWLLCRPGRALGGAQTKLSAVGGSYGGLPRQENSAAPGLGRPRSCW